MKQFKKKNQFGLAAACLCWLVSLGVAFLLGSPLRQMENDLSATPNSGSFTALLLADETTPENRIAPLARMIQHSGGQAVLLRIDEDSPADALYKAQEILRQPGDALLLSYGSSWNTALKLLAEESRFTSGILLFPTGEIPEELPAPSVPVMLLGTSGDREPSPQQLANLYNRLSGQQIAPNGLSFTSQSGNFRLRVVSATVDAYQTFSPELLGEVASWFSSTTGVFLTVSPWEGSLRLFGWAAGIAGLLLGLLFARRLLAEKLLDIGYSLLPMDVSAPKRFLAAKMLGWLGAAAILLAAALGALLLRLQITPLPALFCGYLGILGGGTLLLYRSGKMPGVSGGFPQLRGNIPPRRALLGGAVLLFVLLAAAGLEISGLYTFQPSLSGLPLAFLFGIAATAGIGALLYDELMLDQCRLKPALRLLAELFPFLPLAILAFLAIPGFGFTGSLAVLFLMGALLAAVLLARLLRLILGSFLLPSFLSGLLLGLLAAFGSL